MSFKLRLEVMEQRENPSVFPVDPGTPTPPPPSEPAPAPAPAPAPEPAPTGPDW
jgi:hypothetical protein